MKFKKVSRTATANGEVQSTYTVGNLTVHLTSRFDNKISLEDAIYQIALQRLYSQKKLDGRQNEYGHIKPDMV